MSNLGLGHDALLDAALRSPAPAALRAHAAAQLQRCHDGGWEPTAVYFGLHSGYTFGGRMHTARLQRRRSDTARAMPYTRYTVPGNIATYESNTLRRHCQRRRAVRAGEYEGYDFQVSLAVYTKESAGAALLMPGGREHASPALFLDPARALGCRAASREAARPAFPLAPASLDIFLPCSTPRALGCKAARREAARPGFTRLP